MQHNVIRSTVPEISRRFLFAIVGRHSPSAAETWRSQAICLIRCGRDHSVAIQRIKVRRVTLKCFENGRGVGSHGHSCSWMSGSRRLVARRNGVFLTGRIIGTACQDFEFAPYQFENLLVVFHVRVKGRERVSSVPSESVLHH